MRRTVASTAGVLALGCLLLAGCDRGVAAPSSPAPAATQATTTGSTPSGGVPAAGDQKAADNAVDPLLDGIDEQLNDDDRPTADQD